jgi:hypothetical protein
VKLSIKYLDSSTCWCCHQSSVTDCTPEQHVNSKSKASGSSTTQKSRLSQKYSLF